MTRLETSLEQDTLIFLDMDQEWDKFCEHSGHSKLQRGHSNSSAVVAVRGVPIPCCGFTSMARHLCKTWIQANHTLRCPKCGHQDLLFEDCYEIIGDVE